jgi:hypothetical protein
LPPNAKITAEVCSGRRRPNEVHGRSKFSAGHASWHAISSPTVNPAMPQNIAMTEANLIGPRL